MKKIKTRTKAVILILILIIIAIFYFYKSPAPELGSTSAKCPENYGEDDAGTAEYRDALMNWASEFFETNPEATMSDWSMAKYQVWVDNNCTVAMQRSKLSGEVSDLKPWELVDYTVQYVISNIIEAPLYISELGFSFYYLKDMFVMSDPDAPRLYIIPNSYEEEDGDEAITVIVISAMLNDPQMTPLEWLKSPNSGADMSKGYDTLDIDGQEAISMNGGTWVVVNTPDNKRQLSITFFPSDDAGKSSLLKMNIIINSLIFDK